MEDQGKCLRQKTLNEIIFEGIPSRIKYSGQLKKNINKLASLLKDGCFDDKPKYRADAVKESRDEIDLMAEVANLVVNKGKLNLKDIRLTDPSLRQMHVLSNIIALRNESVPINHHLCLEEFVEQNNEKLHNKPKERRSDAKLLSIFRRVLPRMNLLLSTSVEFANFKMPYWLADRRSPTRFNAIIAKYFKDFEWVKNKFMDKKVSYKDLRELFSLSQGFKEHFYEILDDKEFMNDVKGDYFKLVKVCFKAFKADPATRHHCLKRYSLPTTESEMQAAISHLKRNCREGVKYSTPEELTRANSTCTNLISKPKVRLRL